MTRRFAQTVLALVTVCAAVQVGGAATAHAAEVAPPGTLSLVPAKGGLDTPMNVVTSAMCPAGDYFTVAVKGRGLSTEGDNITGATPLEALLPFGDNQMNIPLSSTWRDFAADNAGSTLSGRYVVEVRCREALDFRPLARFVGTVSLTKAGYSAVGAAALGPEQQRPAPAASSGGSAATPAPTPEASSAAPPATTAPAGGAGQSTPSAAASPSGQVTAEPGTAGPSTASPPMATPSSGWSRFAVVGGGVLLLLGVAMAWFARRRRPAPVPDPEVDVIDHDEVPVPDPAPHR